MEQLIPLTAIETHISFERYPEGNASLDALRENVSTEDIQRITEIANQPIVRQWVTEQYSGPDGVYGEDDAEAFIDFAENGWINGTHFIYVIRGQENRITGAIDIKSADRESAEIGYWADTKGQSGYMTNAVIALSDMATRAGYKQLYGRVKVDNHRSRNVLKRAGFTEQPADDPDELLLVKQLI